MTGSITAWLGELPTAAVVALIVLVAVQLSVQIYDLIDLGRRESVSHGKLLWVLVIVFGNLLGALAYLALARDPEHLDESDAAPTGPPEAALDALYGEPGVKDKR